VAEMRIGELARHSRVKVETIRYYERIGLLPVPPRTAAGYRLYGTAELRRLAFIRRARELGFTIAAVRNLAALSSADACAEARQIASAHLADIRAKIADLNAMERVLAEAVERCSAGEAPRCPIIETLSAA
jgi:MerR family mercuric resistance operon transcriptional regulator